MCNPVTVGVYTPLMATDIRNALERVKEIDVLFDRTHIADLCTDIELLLREHSNQARIIALSSVPRGKWLQRRVVTFIDIFSGQSSVQNTGIGTSNEGSLRMC